MSDRHAFHPSILREYDIRGVVGATLGADDAAALGRGFGTVVRRGGGRTVFVGEDGRLSSPRLADALVAGLAASGADVVRVGLGPTPMLYYATHEGGGDAGIMVTGSHNPPDHNGFKMVLGRKPFYGRAIVDLGALVAGGDLATGRGEVSERDVLEAYVDRLARGLEGMERVPAAAWDAGNGAAGEAMARLVRRLPGRHVLLNEAIDGRFPNHHPDPTVPRNLEQLIATVRREGLDLGIAFDGDGDRIGVVDRGGEVLWGDQLLAILASDVLARMPGATIIADVKASQVLFDEIGRLGGQPLMWRTGHSLIKAKMAETGAPLAGEMSGHIFFADGWYGFDDALYAAVRLLRVLGRTGRDLAEWRGALPRVVNTPELRFDCADDRKFGLVAEIADRLRNRGARLNDIDGVRVQTDDGWWLLRASNTQPVVVARCEAGDAIALGRVKRALAAELAASGFTPPSF
jgi:phosphomannomutase